MRRIFPDVHAAGKNDFSSFRRRRKPGRGLPFLDFSPEDEGRKSPVGCLPLSGCLLPGSPRSGIAGERAAAAAGRKSPVGRLPLSGCLLPGSPPVGRAGEGSIFFVGKGITPFAGWLSAGGGGGMGARPINGYIWLFSFHYLPFLAGKAKKRRPLKWALEKLDTSGQGKRAPSEKSGPRASGDGLPAAATPIIRGADPAVFCRKPCNAGKEIFRPSILWKPTQGPGTRTGSSLFGCRSPRQPPSREGVPIHQQDVGRVVLLRVVRPSRKPRQEIFIPNIFKDGVNIKVVHFR